MKELDYWLAKPDPKDVVNRLEDEDFGVRIWSSNPMCQAWMRNSAAYFSPVIEPSSWDSALIPLGAQGELVRMMVPVARQAIREIIGIITQQNMAFSALANNSKSDVVTAMRIADAYIKKLIRDEYVESKWDFCLEQMMVTGQGFMGATFETDKGYPYAVSGDGTSLVYSGDVSISTPTVWDMLYDFQIQHWEDLDWLRVRKIKNRYTLMAQFPQLKEEIANLPSTRDEQGPYRYLYRLPSEDDYVFVYELYHKETPALPNGRMLFYSTSETIYHDDINQYGCIPYETAKAEVVTGTGFGYPMFSNLLPASEMLDTIASSIATNQSAFAVQNVVVPRGSAIEVNDILGMNFIPYTPMPGVPGGGKPEALNLTSTPAEVYKFLDKLEGFVEKLSGVSGALRGDPPPGVTAGTAIATLTATAIQSINSGAKSAKDCLRKTLRHAVKAKNKFGHAPEILSMRGQGKDLMSREFTGKDLDPIDDIEFVETNPLMQTLSGRLEIANQILAQNPQNIKAYFNVLEGEPPKEMYDKELSEEDLMKRENEALTDGEEVISLSTDDHPAHIAFHAKLLNDPRIRLRSDKVQIILNHMLEHDRLAKETDPVFMAMVQTGKMPEGGLQSGVGAEPPGAPPQPPGNMPPETPGLPTAEPAQPAEDLLARG
jgi:hypothetical protein